MGVFMKPRSIVFGVLALLLFGSANPDPFPDDYFRSPLGIDSFLSGGFGEMRNNHFHSGLDIKTMGQSGYRVYAAADGWVSRIVVSASGYGNALYVSHDNGYQTVYAHLSRFRRDIQAYVKENQYETESFAVELFPNRDQFLVGQREEIALSGNSGSTGGPHLHFEIRDERTSYPVNPFLWGLGIKDTTPPRIYRLMVYAIGDESSIRFRDFKTGGWRKIESGDALLLDVKQVNGQYILDRVDRIESTGEIAFGLQTHDYQEGSSSRLGAFQIRLTENDRTLFQSTMEQFSFNQTRFINAHVDYAERQRSGRWVQRSFVLPGNKLPLYVTRNNGILSTVEGSSHSLKYEVKDAYGNLAEFEFSVKGVGHINTPQAHTSREESPLSIDINEAFVYRSSGFSLNIPPGALYQADTFQYANFSSDDENIYSSVHQVHKPDVPVHTWMNMEIVPTRLPVEKRNKAFIASLDENGRLSWVGGTWANGVVRTRLRKFGSYAVGIDDTPPTIRLLNISENKNMSRSSEIRMRIRDNMSGIKSYEGRINGDWVLFEYDSKNSLLRYRFDNRLASGSHRLEMRVTDNKDNVALLSLTFSR